MIDMVIESLVYIQPVSHAIGRVSSVYVPTCTCGRPERLQLLVAKFGIGRHNH